MLDQIFSALKIELEQIVVHAIGFIIAFLILKKFAWKPLLKLLDDRRERIKNEFDDIEAKHQEVYTLKNEYGLKLKDIDQEARKRLTEAVNEGEKISARLKDDAREESKEIISKAHDEAEREVAKAKVALKEDMVNMALTATEKIINERLDDKKHRDLVGSFIDQLNKE